MKFFNRIAQGLLLLTLITYLSGCAATNAGSATADGTEVSSKKSKRKAKKPEPYNPVGVWEYSVDAPDGTNYGTMRITGADGIYEVVLETDQFGEIELYDLEIIETVLTAKFDVGGITADIEGDFDGDNFSGAVYLGDDAFPLEAKRTSK